MLRFISVDTTESLTPKRKTKEVQEAVTQPEVEANKAAGKEYLVPEYYEHDLDTYGQLFVDMEKYRIPQPSAKE